MPNYLETIYFRDEYSEKAYPQKLCNYIYENIIKKKLSKTEGLKLLDVGSGKGNHLVGFSRKNIECYGIDKREECLKIVDKFTIKECDLEKDKFPYDDDYFDIVFSKSVIEHVNNADNILSETFRVLKKGGIAIMMTPDWGTQYKIFWDDYTHVKAWTRKGLQDALHIHNFKNSDSTLFRQLPILWKYPFLNILADITSFLPERFKWKDKEEKIFREWVRFSKEKMLIGFGRKL
jgi:ubiquinone/menaquinone biosynthesis C-methylase UbiE